MEQNKRRLYVYSHKVLFPANGKGKKGYVYAQKEPQPLLPHTTAVSSQYITGLTGKAKTGSFKRRPQQSVPSDLGVDKGFLDIESNSHGKKI